MLGFVHAEPWENPGVLTRLRCAVNPDYGTEVSRRSLFGRPALFVRQRRAAQEAPMRVLAEHGVDKVAFAGAGKYTERAGAHPLQEMDSSYLYTYLAGDVGTYVAERSGATAALFFRTVGQLEEQVLLKMAGSFRYLMLSAQRDSGAICRALRRRYGLPVVENPTPSQVKNADFALMLHPPGRDMALSGRCLVFRPHGGAPESLRSTCQVSGGVPITGLSLDVPQALAAEIPAGFQAEPILSEAAFRGQIDPSKIKIHSISIDKNP